jgi:hypothetical protein
MQQLWGHLHMISHYTNCTLVQAVASYWYYSGQTGRISNTRRIFKCILYYNNNTAIQNLPLNSTSVVPTPKIQRIAILILERLGSPATPHIAIVNVQMRIIVVACKRDMDTCFWSIIFPSFTCLHQTAEYLSPSETQAQCSRHYHVIIRKLQITRLGRL